MTNLNHAAVLAFFTGKSLENATRALALLEESMAHGSWTKGSKVKVHAALSKSNLAAKVAKPFSDLSFGFEYNDPRRKALQGVYFTLAHGRFDGAKLDVSSLESESAYADLLATFRAYVAAFAPVAAALAKLDASRPVPVITAIGASPTVTATLQSLEAVKVDVCPMEFFQVERINAKTKKVEFVTVVKLLWPEGTLHGSSRWQHQDDQCEACGHRISNPYNWVPLVLNATDGTPKSLWVGRDCASTLFGVELTGDLEIEGR